jgi:predicted TIM-barrel fold metal-dependent hydrolase
LQAVTAALTVAASACTPADDNGLRNYIDSIRAIDNHSHVVAPDAERDRGFDALPCDAAPASASLPPANVRFGPHVLDAWRALWGFTGSGGDDAQVRAALQAQQAVREREKDGYFPWVLDRAGIDIVLANRVTMTADLPATRFRWVPYDDALLFPLDNSLGKAQSPDRKVFFEREEQLLSNYLRDAGVAGRPASLDEYLDVVHRTLQRQKDAGAVAIKFEVAYLRSLDFAPAEKSVAAAVYERAGMPGASDYKTLQDYIFREIALEAGRLGLVVHIHTGNGCGDSFEPAGAQPLLLSSMLNDIALRQTRFVLLHGGSPFERTISALIVKPNVYVDTSVLSIIWTPADLARTLRPWLETMPEHVMFGTDAGPWGPGLGWEESTWSATRLAREALTRALTEMIRDEAMTSARAREVADRVLRDNAIELYGLNRQ